MTKTRVFLISALIIPICSVICAFFTLKNLGDILLSASSVLGQNTADTLSDIFLQLKNADISVHFILPVFWYSVYCYLGSKILGLKKHPALNILWVVLIGIAFLIICYISALLLTKVNDIRFGHILFSLSETIENGLFDVL